MTTSFWVIGDTGYTSSAATALNNYMNSVPDNVKFVVHVGDMISDKISSPSLDNYTSVASTLLHSSKPVFIIPGDNEIIDTTNPTLAWQRWRESFQNFDQHWSYSFQVNRQVDRAENFAFVTDGVLYIGIDLVGASQSYNAQEFATRAADDLAWIQSNLAACKGDVTCAVIFAQASTSGKGYGELQTGFVAAAQDFQSPILYVQGDLHKWIYDNPYPDAPNVTRVVIAQTQSGPNNLPLLVTVTDDATHPFSFDHVFPNAPVIGTEQADMLVGNSGANTIYGMDGGDNINGGAGADRLYGDAGDDILIGGSGADYLDGGTGINTASYATSSKAINISLAMGRGSGGDAQGDILINIQNLIGSSQNDVLIGDAQANIIDGGKGNDTLDGGAGNDTLIGGTGNDIYIVDSLGDKVWELPGEGTDKVQSFISFDLSLDGANVENLDLLGTSPITGTGNALANIITGNSADNILDGGVDGPGKIVDQLKGGGGDDTYIVRDAYDTVTEGSNQGTDTVQSFVSYVLGSNVENLELQGSEPLNGTGNSLANVITGNSGSNILNGKAGDDILTGGAGVDVFVFDTTLSTTKTSNVDHITDFEMGVDKIWLNKSVFKIALGNLTSAAFTSNTTGSAAESNQTRIIYDQSDGFLYYDADGTGSQQATHFATIDNHPANLTASDFFVGGTGNDTYIVGENPTARVAVSEAVDSVGDVIWELPGQGTDKVQSFISFDLSVSGANVENLDLLGTSPINGAGNALANIITGNSANNVLDGGIDGPGKIVDQLKGGAGDDTYIVRDAYDKVTEGSNQGTDTVQSFVSYVLGSNVENLELQGSEPLNGTGNSLANVITGSSGSNILNGKAGDDILTGGAGVDVFGFDTTLSTAKTSNVDHIVDFEVGVDKISLNHAIFKNIALGDLTSTAFTSNITGSVAESNQTHIIYDQSDGFLYYDADGTGSQQAIHFATLDNHPANLTASDLFVV